MSPLILLTGATDYVGGELLKALLAGGHRVRCLARRPEALRTAGGAGAEVVRGDVLDAASVRAAMTGVDTAYYLVHSMGSPGSLEAEDRAAARIFGDAARKAADRLPLTLPTIARPTSSSRSFISTGNCGERSCALKPRIAGLHSKLCSPTGEVDTAAAGTTAGVCVVT